MYNPASSFGADQDIIYMEQALALAATAFDHNEVPIAALVVDAQGIIIGQAANTVEQSHTQIAHAECLAIAQAGKQLQDWRLEGCWIYVTLEPCAMCMHLILLSRACGVVYGASSPLFGFHLDNNLQLQLYKKSNLQMVQGVCGSKAEEILKKFFKTKRKNKDE